MGYCRASRRAANMAFRPQNADWQLTHSMSKAMLRHSEAVRHAGSPAEWPATYAVNR